MTLEEYKKKVEEFMRKQYSKEWVEHTMSMSEAELKEAYEENCPVGVIGVALGMGLM